MFSSDGILISASAAQHKVYIENLFWSEHYEITGMVRVAISQKVYLFNPIYQQTSMFTRPKVK